MLSEGAVQDDPAVVAEVTAAERQKEPSCIFDKSQLLRKLEARKAAWKKPEVKIDVDRLLNSGAVPVAAGIDLVIEEDEKGSQDQAHTTPSSSPSNREGRDASVETESQVEDAHEAPEGAYEARNVHKEGFERLEAAESVDTAAPCVHTGTDPSQQSNQANLCSTAEDLASGERLATDRRSAEIAKDMACVPTQPFLSVPSAAGAEPVLSVPADSEDSRHRSEPAAATAVVCRNTAEVPPDDAGDTELGSADKETENGAVLDQLQDEGSDSEDADDMDEDEQDELNIAEEHDGNTESLADKLEDDEADEEDSADAGSEEVEDPADDDEALVDEMEGGSDEDDEEAELLAAIQRERKMQDQLQDHNAGPVPFCDGEAEQSEDEAASSDEDDDDNGAGMSVEEITEMMKELREKGTGEEEIAAAHSKWLEEEDANMLKRLVRDMKRGFNRRRKRVQDDGDDWDQEDARMRRKEVVGEQGIAMHLADVTQMTTAQMMRQYKRKLATIDDEDAPATPVRRVRSTARTAVPLEADENADDANLPMLPDSDGPGLPGIGRAKQAANRDGVFSLKGPTLLQGKRKKNVEAIRAHSAGFLPCMLGMQEDATARNNSSHL